MGGGAELSATTFWSFRSEFSSRPTTDTKQRFEREARSIAALNDPHICTLYDVGQADGTDFLVMEYLEGETLAERLEKGALPLDQALQIVAESDA